jgi:hypothetical protein
LSFWLFEEETLFGGVFFWLFKISGGRKTAKLSFLNITFIFFWMVQLCNASGYSIASSGTSLLLVHLLTCLD